MHTYFSNPAVWFVIGLLVGGFSGWQIASGNKK